MQQFCLKYQQLMMENGQWNQHLHVPTQTLVIVVQEMGEGWGGQVGGGGGGGDMPKIPPLSQTTKAKDI